MSKKNIAKIVFDIAMTGILVLLYNSHVFAISFHEVAGLILSGLFIIHCVFNKKWITTVSAKLFSKSLAPRVRIGYIVNVLLLITFTLIIISGIRTSQVLFPQFAAPKGTPWRAIHHFAGAMSIILVGVHVGLHWGFIKGMWKKVVHIPSKIAKPLSVCLLVALLGFGLYSMVTSSFVGWLSEPFTTSYNSAQQANAQQETDTTINDPKTDTNNYGHKPKDGENKGDDTNNSSNDHSTDEKKSDEGNPATIIHTILTFLSIIGVFAVKTYFLDKWLLKKR